MNHSDVIDEVSQRVRDELAKVEMNVLTEGPTLASLMREGSAVSDQARNWTGPEGEVCALSAAEAALRARK